MSHEEDAFIAEKLFGWQLFPYLVIGEERYCPPGEVHIGTIKEVPAYTSDPAADYQVLVKVRETWDDMDMNEFSRQVCKQCKIRLGTDYVTDGTVWIFLQGYTPGAYSRAALAVLKARE